MTTYAVTGASGQLGKLVLDELLQKVDAADVVALARDPDVARALRERLEAGSVWVNALDRASMAAPFGGIKHSGLGVEKSRWAFNEYLQPRAIYFADE